MTNVSATIKLSVKPDDSIDMEALIHKNFTSPVLAGFFLSEKVARSFTVTKHASKNELGNFTVLIYGAITNREWFYESIQNVVGFIKAEVPGIIFTQDVSVSFPPDIRTFTP